MVCDWPAAREPAVGERVSQSPVSLAFQARVPPPTFVTAKVWSPGLDPWTVVKEREVVDRPILGPAVTVRVAGIVRGELDAFPLATVMAARYEPGSRFPLATVAVTF
jgi:hypothetical protein